MDEREVLKIIERAAKDGRTKLYLFGEDLTSIPAEIGNLTNLTELHLVNSKLMSLPAEIGNLTNLTTLNLDYNQLRSVPAEIGNLANLRRLQLDKNQLTSIPAEIGNLANLTELYLKHNQLTSVPAEIGNLANLRELSLSTNRLTSVPVEIWNLANLTCLYLHENQLTSVPSEIGNLANLQILRLDENQLTSVPAEIWNLGNLTILSLSNNQLASVPAEIGNLANLTGLYLYDNQLRSVPAEICNLANLTRLDLHNNQLTSVPAEIGNLANLTILYLFNNQLTSVPAEIGKLNKLEILNLDGNAQLSSPPPEVIQQGTKAVLAYLRGEKFIGGLETTRGIGIGKLKLRDPGQTEVSLFYIITEIVMSSPDGEDTQNLKPLWLKFKQPAQISDVSTAMSVLSNLAALIRVFHRESTAIPTYTVSLGANSPWHEKEQQEQEARLTSIFLDPLRVIKPEERLRVYRLFEGSYYLGLGNLPNWLWKKLHALWEIIPQWKQARAEAEKVLSEAERTRRETESVGPRSEVEIKQEWEKLYKMQQDRLLDGVERRIDLIKKVLDIGPPECKALPPKAVMALLSKLMSTMDDAAAADDLGSLLTDDAIKELPPIETKEIETDGSEKV